jgi:GH24 family phage-related lysozyme (muramidase)
VIDKDLMRAELSRDEGRKPRIYKDAVGKITGGVGRNLSDREFSDDEIDLMLDNDIALSEAELDKVAPWWRHMSGVRQRVLLNMHFNMGWPRLSQFKNTLAAMQSGDYAKAADGMLASVLAQQVGQRSVRLAKMMRTGEA